MNVLVKVLVLVSALSISICFNNALAITMDELATMTDGSKVAFLLVFDPTAIQVEKAKVLIEEAQKRIPNCELVLFDRSLPEHAELVTKFRLAGAPVPLILVMQSGIVTGGVPAERATVEILQKMISSPKKIEVTKNLVEGKAVFIVAQRQGMKTTENIFGTCMSACMKMNNKSAVVKIDMDDKAELEFLKLLKVDLAATEPVTLVANAQGQITNLYSGAVAIDDLVQSATKKVGGCCPSTVTGGSKGCAPAK